MLLWEDSLCVVPSLASRITMGYLVAVASLEGQEAAREPLV